MSTADQQSSAPQPPAALQDLAFFHGAWDADGIFHETPFAARKPITMDISVTPEHRGFWLRFGTAELASPDNPNPLTATYLWSYDPAAGQYVANWFDSNGGRAGQTSAGWKGDTLVFEGEMTNSGYTFPLRDTFTRRGSDEYHHIGEVDLGQGWIPVDEETVRRRR